MLDKHNLHRIKTFLKLIGLALGPLLFVLLLLIPAPFSMPPAAWKVALLTLWMALWWMTETVPIAITALLPLLLLPLLGVMPVAQTSAPYANHLIFMFMGGFFMAKAMEKWGLHKRLALHTIYAIGYKPHYLVLGFMAATALLSMWVSNTATVAMMIMIAPEVIKQFEQLSDDENHRRNFGTAMLLGVAYAASVGGVATIIGTPPNLVAVGIIENTYHQQINFFQWLLFGLPLSIVMLFVVWIVLTFVLYPVPRVKTVGGNRLVKESLDQLGPMSKTEKRVLAVVVFVAISWILRGVVKLEFLSQVTDTTISLIGAILLFAISSGVKTDSHKREALLDWDSALKIPWGILLLFGGGLALGEGFAVTGLADWLVTRIALLDGLNLTIFIFIVVGLTMFLSTLTSNTATAALVVPIAGSAAIAMNLHPYGFIVTSCVAASYAFILPVSSPPNAMVHDDNYVTIRKMTKAGVVLSLIGAILITLFVVFVLPPVWGIDLVVLPDWIP